MNPFIGVSGVATSGKDTFGNLLIERLGEHGYIAKRFAFADELKEEVAPFIQKEYNINIFDCTKEEKAMLRPLMVLHGEMKRKMTNGRYWIDKLQVKIAGEVAKQPDLIPVITDVRYAFYPEDELFWIKEKHGLVVHVERYVYAMGEDFESEKYTVPPANEVEEKHNAQLKERADYRVSWETCPDPKRMDVNDWCRMVVAEFYGSPLMRDFVKRCYHPRRMI